MILVNTSNHYRVARSRSNVLVSQYLTVTLTLCFGSNSLHRLLWISSFFLFILYLIYIPFVNWSISSIVIPATGCVDRATMCHYGPQFMGIWYIYMNIHLENGGCGSQLFIASECWYPMHTRNNGNAMSYITMLLDTYWYW